MLHNTYICFSPYLYWSLLVHVTQVIPVSLWDHITVFSLQAIELNLDFGKVLSTHLQSHFHHHRILRFVLWEEQAKFLSNQLLATQPPDYCISRQSNLCKNSSRLIFIIFKKKKESCLAVFNNFWWGPQWFLCSVQSSPAGKNPLYECFVCLFPNYSYNMTAALFDF